jgi:hypothetical protein
MRHRYAFIAILILALHAAGCSSTIEPASTQSAWNLRVMSVVEDSLHPGERAVLVVNDSTLDASSLKLFAGTDRFEIDSISQTNIISAPVKGEGGRIRLYQDEVLAEGAIDLIILQRHDIALLRKLSFYPIEGKIGDTVTLKLDTLVEDVHSLDLNINRVRLQYLSSNGNKHLYRIPEGTTDGMVTATFFGKTAELHYYDVRTENEAFLEEGRIGAVMIDLGLGLSFKWTDTLAHEYPTWFWSAPAGIHASALLAPVTASGTTYRAHFEEKREDYERFADISLTLDTTTDLVSGRITVTQQGQALEPGPPIIRCTISFSGLPWQKSQGVYTLSCIGTDSVKSALVDLSVELDVPRDGWKSTLDEYFYPEFEDAMLSIRLSR